MSDNKASKAPAPIDSEAAKAAEVKQFLRKVQAYTGVAFGVFLILHFITTISATFGPAVYNETLNTFRKLYQNPLLEGGLAFSAITHMIAGANLHWRRDKFGFAKAPHAPWFLKVQRFSGSLLGAIIFVHVSGTRLPSFLGRNILDDFDHMHIVLKLAPEFSFIYLITYSILGMLHLMLGIPQILELFHILPTGSHRRIASSPLFWLVTIAFQSALISGMWGFYSFPASKAGLEYWLPIITANLPPSLVTGSL